MFLPADENKQQISYSNLNKGVRKINMMVFTAEVMLLLTSSFPLEKSAASLCFKNSIYYIRLKSKKNRRISSV